jgi:hypothetical protein
MYAYYIGLLSIIRFLGVIIFIDYYRKEKRLRFLVLTVAFLFLAASPLIELIIIDLSDIALYEFIFLISETFAILGIYLLALIFFDYVSEYDKKYEMVIGAFLSIVLLLLYFILPFDVVDLIGQIIILMILLLVFFHGIYNRTRYLKLTNNSVYFFMLMAISIIFNVVLSNFPSSLELEIIVSLSSISISTFGIFIFVHLEYTLLLTKKNLIKDNYSHKLAQILQAIMGRVEFAKGNVNPKEVESQLNEAMEDCKKGSNLLYKIREL